MPTTWKSNSWSFEIYRGRAKFNCIKNSSSFTGSKYQSKSTYGPSFLILSSKDSNISTLQILSLFLELSVNSCIINSYRIGTLVIILNDPYLSTSLIDISIILSTTTALSQYYSIFFSKERFSSFDTSTVFSTSSESALKSTGAKFSVFCSDYTSWLVLKEMA